jgi:hypothetical protein
MATEEAVKRKTFVLSIVLALATVGSAFAGKVSIAGSPYGDPTGHPEVNCTAPECILPAGVTMTEQDFPFSFGPGEAFYFKVTSDVSNFTLTLLGAENFVADDTSNTPPEFFGFGALCPGGDVAPCNQTTMTPDFSDGTTNKVSFSVPGNGNGLSFFAVEPAASNSTTFVNDIRALDALGVTATLTLNSSSVPEPSSLALIVLVAVSFLLLRRFRGARQS